MDKLPIISGQDLIKLLLKLDYQVHHQTGSHIILRQNKEPFRRLTIPNHKEISRGTLRAIIRQAGITREEFLELL
jgi:predicted RNA binding protein YcfA (HicA-like mRNA interferase family)